MCSRFISISMPAHVIVALGTCYYPIWSRCGFHTQQETKGDVIK